GTRGGVFSGQVVVGSSSALKGVAAQVSDLKGPGGASIPASAVLIRYAQLGPDTEDTNEALKAWDGGSEVRYKRKTQRFEALLPEAPAEVPVSAEGGVALQPIFLTVRVPRDAKPGEYRGGLTVRAGGKEAAKAELRLSVSDWALADPQDFLTHSGLVQSPHSIAMQYKVPLWSEEHWKLIDKSFEFAAQLGCETVYVPLLRRTYFGNEHSMVRWIRNGNGKWDHDVSIAERYLETAIKHLRKPPVICFVCWELATGSHYAGMTKASFVANTGVCFTIKDPKTGKLEEAVGPKWGDPEATAFWKPVFDKMRGILAKHGLEGSMMLGVTGDRHPREDAVKDLKAAADVPWVKASHFGPSPIHGQPIGYATEVWGVGLPPDPSVKRQYGWKRTVRTALFPRFRATPMGKALQTKAPVGMYRLGFESCLAANSRGVGRCGLDFWPVLKDKRGRPQYILGRYPENSNWHGGWLHNSFPYILWPGKDGPVATVRFEAYREGLQEAEARIFLEKILSDPAKRAKLGDALAAEIQEVLDERIRAIRRTASGSTYFHYRWYVGAGPGTPAATKKLYDAAAKAAAR
ncbi:MAG: glycoside hydrolase domain-containing protein, partial [Planctomycetota bacterium]